MKYSLIGLLKRIVRRFVIATAQDFYFGSVISQAGAGKPPVAFHLVYGIIAR